MNKLILGLAAVILPLSALAQTNEIRGRVTDSLANPVPYAVVVIEGTYISTQTDGDGAFLLHSKSDSGCCLIVHALGYTDFRKCYDSPPPNVNVIVKQSPYMKDEVVVSATRVDNNSGVAFTNVSKEQISQENFGQDLPYVLNNQTSVVTTSDAGNGFGYTGVRIRGSDATRINVTINGIPVNDAESQGAFWVDMPDIVSSTENIQIQRGIGTSTNGAGAFGGSLNLQTELNRRNAYSDLTLSGGSFNSWRATAKAGTGIINKRWSFDLRLSQLGSDGFIDRGRSDLRSWYLSGGYYGDKLSVKAITFSGRERTYQCWNGVPDDSIMAGNYTYNPAGIYYDSAGTELFYKDQVDAYGQDYYQLHFILQGNEKWMFNWSLFATRGKGYYEEYKEDQSLSDYNINDNSSNVNDLIRRRWLDNWYYGIVYAAHYNSGKNISMTIGGASTIFDGKHFGEVIWATGLPAGETLGGHYYDDDAQKTDHNIFVKVNYAIGEKIHVFGDVQARMINYSFTGLDSTGAQLPQDADFLFVNPKAGIIAHVAKNQTVYLSFGVGNKEPNRDDFTNSSPASRPLHETLYDVEAGWKFGSNKLGMEVNLYYMLYKNQLVLTGKVNDVGAYTRENVAESYRRGIEITVGYNISKQFNISGNATLSQNKIGEFHEFMDDYDIFIQQENVFLNTDIAFSPSVISAGVFTWNNGKGINASVIGKFVGKQFLDNTSSYTRQIDPYFTLGLNASWTAIRPGTKENQKLSELRFGVQVSNLLNTMYSSNGYTYGYIYTGMQSRYNYYYPQAGITVMGMVSMKFGGE
ncbi:MAG TPA: TonB-dependent receptor [Bacteroidia bacterium]|nr:TonB-dependent receptor [Bacteroidia bacterium]